MPRPPRPQIPGGLYHITSRSNHGRVVFGDDAEREVFLSVLAETVEKRRWSCRSYCLLSTHYHLVVATPDGDIAAGIQCLNSRFAQWANWHRAERSHIFEGRYKSVLVETDAHAIELHRYIALNPVRAGLVRNPEDWTWSSVRATLGRIAPPDFLDVSAALATFGGDFGTARRRLRVFLRDGLLADSS